MDLEYKKRSGTSGISGHYYETKLISLILFRLLHDDTIQDFWLGSNLDGIGAFDDICLKIKVAGRDRPVVVFVQVKHKDNDDKSLSLDNKSDAIKWCDSIMKIKKRQVSSKNADEIFSENIDATDYIFILYTNANCDFMSNNKFESDYATTLNNLLATSGIVGLQPINEGKHLNDLGENMLETDLSWLAEKLANFLNDKKSMNILSDEFMRRYHVILRQNVVDVSDIQTDQQKPDLKWRIMTFSHEFFDTCDEFLVLFRERLFEQIHKTAKFWKTSNTETSSSGIEELISAFFSEPSAVTLSALIVTHIKCDINGKLLFVFERSENDIKRLQEINISLSTIHEAKVIAAKNKLKSLKLKVPIAFGNIDLVLRPKTIESRLNRLTDAIVGFCQNYTEIDGYKVVTIDDTIDAGILDLNGGLASAVGNILVYDSSTKLSKFSNDATTLQNNAKALFVKLKDKIDNFLEYRFEINTLKFPKLSLDCTCIARDFLSKLIIYPNQMNQQEVENILKKEIQQHYTNFDTDKSGSVFLHFHDEIQKWWSLSNTAPYLTKDSDFFKKAIKNIEMEPKISVLQYMFYVNNIRYISYRFNEETMRLFELHNTASKLAIVTDLRTLTILKTIQYINSGHSTTKYVVIDLEFILKLPEADFNALGAELRGTEKVVIIVCDNSEYNIISHIRLTELVAATIEKHVIVITNDLFLEAVRIVFACTDNVLYDKTQSLVDLTPETQQEVISNSKVLFQGSEVGLDLFVDDESTAFIKGTVLNKIISNQTIRIGWPLSNTNYDEIKHLYVDRRVTEVSYNTDDIEKRRNEHVVRTFCDISDEAVLITSAPGMGKSTLLTHLSVETNKLDKNFWIIRINLLDYSKQFYKWQEDDTALNTLETLKFVCHVVLKNDNISINLNEKNNKVFLEGCSGDELATFELNMLLHFYNKRRLILLFDGFDEICPHYKNSVVMFLNIVKTYPQKNKMWVTSRPYSDILPDLQKVLGKYYILEGIDDKEQETYLKNIWNAKLRVYELNPRQLETLESFIDYIPRICRENTVIVHDSEFVGKICFKIFYSFYNYVLLNLPANKSHDILHSHMIKYANNSRPTTLTLTDTLDDMIAEIVYPPIRYLDAFFCTPLLLYIIADDIINKVDTYKDNDQFHLDMNIFTIYEMFIDNKLKKIQFQDKNKMDVYNPDIMLRYEKERADCFTIHKKLAAYIVLGRPIFDWMNLEELRHIDPISKEEFDKILYEIKTGKEKSGLISHVTADDEPVFIHGTFAEYFVTEYLCDIFKSEKYTLDVKMLLYGAVFEFNFNTLLPWIIKKSEIDDHVANALQEIRNKQPMSSFWMFDDDVQSFQVMFNKLTSAQRVRIWSSTKDDYESGCFDKYIKSLNFRRFIEYLQDHPSTDTLYYDLYNLQHFISKMKPHFKIYF